MHYAGKHKHECVMVPLLSFGVFFVFLSLFFPSVLVLSGGALGQVFLDTLLFGKICVPGLQPLYMLVTLEIKSCSI